MGWEKKEKKVQKEETVGRGGLGHICKTPCPPAITLRYQPIRIEIHACNARVASTLKKKKKENQESN
jgi:hypothetical protein